MQKIILLSVLFLALIPFNQVDCKYNVKKILNFYESQHNDKLAQFNWQNCGPDTDSFLISTLNVQPDPLRIPGIITINIDASLKNNLTGPITMSLKIIKIVGPVKFEIPCIDNFGSCTYADLCAILPQKNADCPDFFKQNNVPCSCPFVLGQYSAQNLQLEIDLAEKLPGGKYIVVGNFENSQFGHIGCLHLELTVQ